jgi:hypothetical protein
MFGTTLSRRERERERKREREKERERESRTERAEREKEIALLGAARGVRSLLRLIRHYFMETDTRSPIGEGRKRREGGREGGRNKQTRSLREQKTLSNLTWRAVAPLSLYMYCHS